MSKCIRCGDNVYVMPNGHETKFCVLCLFTMFSNLGVLPDTRAATPQAPDPAEQKCPSCNGAGRRDYLGEYLECVTCRGTGISKRSAGG